MRPKYGTSSSKLYKVEIQTIEGPIQNTKKGNNDNINYAIAI